MGSRKGAGMTAKVREIFRNNEEVRNVPAGTVIFSTGESGTEMFGIVTGQVELRVGVVRRERSRMTRCNFSLQ